MVIGGPVKMFSQVDEFLWLEKEAFVIRKRKENLAGVEWDPGKILINSKVEVAKVLEFQL